MSATGYQPGDGDGIKDPAPRADSDTLRGMSSRPPRVLLVRLSALGDVIRALPVLATLRAHRPDAEISWLVEDRAATLLRDHPQIDHLFVYPRRRWQQDSRRPWRWARLVAEVFRFFRSLRHRRFDWSIDLQGNLKSAALVALCGARGRAGFARGEGREGNWMVQSVRVPVPPGIHKMDRGLALLGAIAPIGKPFETVTDVVIPVTAAERQRVLDTLRDQGLERGGFAVLHPGTSAFGEFKRWPPERFGELARWLRERHGLTSLVTWGPGEESLAQRVVDLAGDAARISPAWRSLGEFTTVLESCGLVVGSDTGPTHLAAARAAPTVVLFGPKDPALYAPFGPRVEVVWNQTSCSPCKLRFCPDPICMSTMVLTDVQEAVDRAIRDNTSIEPPES